MRRPGRAAGLLTCVLAVVPPSVSVAAADDPAGRPAELTPAPPVPLPSPPGPDDPRPAPQPPDDVPFRTPRAEQLDPGRDPVPMPQASPGSRAVPMPEAETDPDGLSGPRLAPSPAPPLERGPGPRLAPGLTPLQDPREQGSALLTDPRLP